MTARPQVGLDAPVLDRPTCQTYPSAKGGDVCGEPASLKVRAVRCPTHHPGEEPYLIDVCAWCFEVAGEGLIRHRPCGHTSARDVVWTVSP